MIDRQNMANGGLRSVVMILVCVLLSLEAMAQTHTHTISHDDGPRVRTEWGVGFSGSYTMLDYGPTPVELKPRFGLGGHLHMGLLFGNNFALETEIHYQKGSLDASLAKNEISHRVKTSTVDIPVLLSVRMLDNIIQLDAGAMFTVMSNTEYLHENETMFFGPMYPTFNLAFGAGIRLSRHLLLEAHYVYPLGKTTNQFISKAYTFETCAPRVMGGLTLMF